RHAARCVARPARPDRQQGGLRHGRLRCLQRHRRRTADMPVSHARRRSRGARNRNHRGPFPRGQAPSAAAEVPRDGRAAVRHLHAGLSGRQQGIAGPQPRADRDRGPLLAGRQSLPVHGLRQDRPRGAGDRRRDEGSVAMTSESNVKWIGKNTIRPDGADKVTGRAAYAADATMPGMIWGKILRSPHPHVRIRSIDTSKAEALPGVKAVMTSADFVEFPVDTPVPIGIQDMRWMSRNIMARDKVLFAGHPVAAVAATTEKIAEQALELIEVDYEVLPWVIDVEEAMKPDAPILHDHIRFEGKPSNIAGKLEHTLGDVEAGFAQADVVIERSFRTEPVHQGYIEPHACLVSVSDGKATVWSSSQGQFMVRGM